MAKYRLKKDEVVDDKGYVKKKGFLSWLRNYGYYYKSYLIVALVAIGFLVALVLSTGNVQPDMKVIFAVNEPMDETAQNTLCTNMYQYTVDIDSDDILYLEPTLLHLVENPSTTSEKTDYNTLEKELEHEDTVFFVVDEFGYQHLLERDLLRDLDFFGIQGGEKYRLCLNDTALWEGVEEETPYYLVMKYVPDEEYEGFYLSSVTTMVVEMCYELTGRPA
ncbi:MAG: hypothetical protein E7458_04390 [Ruminococcaceae bacterium]|nr:hypothetical protein [Oscillospiraceae bacterium]